MKRKSEAFGALILSIGRNNLKQGVNIRSNSIDKKKFKQEIKNIFTKCLTIRFFFDKITIVASGCSAVW